MNHGANPQWRFRNGFEVRSEGHPDLEGLYIQVPMHPRWEAELAQRVEWGVNPFAEPVEVECVYLRQDGRNTLWRLEETSHAWDLGRRALWRSPNRWYVSSIVNVGTTDWIAESEDLAVWRRQTGNEMPIAVHNVLEEEMSEYVVRCRR